MLAFAAFAASIGYVSAILPMDEKTSTEFADMLLATGTIGTTALLIYIFMDTRRTRN